MCLLLCILQKTEKTLEAVEAPAKHICVIAMEFTYFNRELKPYIFDLALKFRNFALSI